MSWDTYEPSHRPRWSNCRSWAHHQFRHHGGYILIRRGHHGVPRHWLWSPDHIHVWSYEPIQPWTWTLAVMRRDWLIWFQGEVVKGDDGSAEAWLDELKRNGHS